MTVGAADVVLGIAFVLAIALIASGLHDYVRARRAPLQHFGERFVHEFARPLVRVRPSNRSSTRSCVSSAPGASRSAVGTARRRNYPSRRSQTERGVRRRTSPPGTQGSTVRARTVVCAGAVGGRAAAPAGQPQTGRWHVKILLASTGGGGGNILRSIKALFRQDLALAQKTDARYAERLRRALTTRFLDTTSSRSSRCRQRGALLIGAHRRAGSARGTAPRWRARRWRNHGRTSPRCSGTTRHRADWHGRQGHWRGHDVSPRTDRPRTAEARDPDLCQAVIRMAWVDKRRYDHALGRCRSV